MSVEFVGKYISEILPAQPEHADRLTQITIAAKRHWEYPETWIQLWIPLLTISAAYISENETWMAVVDNKPVGYYSLTLDSVIARRAPSATKQSNYSRRRLLRQRAPRNDEVLWLDNLWVLPAFMAQGIGGNLFKHALVRSLARGAAVLKIEADPNAEGFYRNMGARRVGENRSEVNGQPRILPVMEIRL